MLTTHARPQHKPPNSYSARRIPSRMPVPRPVSELSPEATGRDLSQVPTFGGSANIEQLLAPPTGTSRPGVRDPAEVQADRLGNRVADALASVPVVPGPISAGVLQAVEPVLGAGLAGVEFDAGPAAQAGAARKRALAVTEGPHIAFAAGAFAPTTPAGRALIGHELAHVVQQRTHGVRVAQKFGVVVDYEKLAGQIHSAVAGWGTDEEAIYRALNSLHRDPDSVRELESTYQRRYSETLPQALEGDLDSDELDYAKGLLGKPIGPNSKQAIAATPTTPAQWDAQARRIKEAAEYRTLGIFWGTDEEAIFAVLEPLAGDAEKIENIKEAYTRIAGGGPGALVAELRDEMSGSELEHALELLVVPDPHTGTSAELSSGQVGTVRNELRPTTAAGPSAAPALWDGRAGAPGAATKRAELKAQLTADLDAHLARNKVGIDAAAGAGTIPLTALEGAANAAVEVTDDEYKSSYGASATTPTQAALRAGFEFKQSTGNLLDASDPATRAAARIPISARSVAEWAISNDDPPTPPGAREHMAAHGFDPERTTHGEDTFLDDSVITPFLASAPRRTQLERYDRFAFGFQPRPGKIAILPQVVGGALGAGQPTPNVADRSVMWSTWHIAVHEYLHNLTHPAFEAVVRGPVMREGFTEYFTKGVLTKVAPVAHQNVGLVRKVEGGTFTPPTTPAIVGPYTTPPTYAPNLVHVENISHIVPGGDGAVRSAYFQGHIEMLGLDPATLDFVAAPPVAADPAVVDVPAGITTVPDLANRSGVPESQIRAANPGLPAVGLPARVKIPGARAHRVAATVTGTSGAAGLTETAEQIATQNGISVATLKRANPTVNWSALRRGQLLLIPRRQE